MSTIEEDVVKERNGFRLTAMLPKEIYDWVSDTAQKEDRSKSAIVRRILELAQQSGGSF